MRGANLRGRRPLGGRAHSENDRMYVPDPEEYVRADLQSDEYFVVRLYANGTKATSVERKHNILAIAEAQQLRLDYERRSMTLEDCRSNLDRNCLRFQ